MRNIRQLMVVISIWLEYQWQLTLWFYGVVSVVFLSGIAKIMMKGQFLSFLFWMRVMTYSSKEEITLVGVVVALGLMILRFIFSDYSCVCLSLLYLQRCDESAKSWPSQWGKCLLLIRDSKLACFQQSQILQDGYTCKEGNGELQECDLDQSSACPPCIFRRVLFLRGGKNILSSECTE